MKRVLMIAYHFPPIQGSSGVQRTVQFARHLPSFGWTPMVVAPHPRAYPKTGDDSWADLPRQVIVARAFAMDSARHLSFRGRYFGLTAMPDRWVSWVPAAVIKCLQLIRKYRPQVVWSTFPVASAHLIGLLVNRFSGLPWVADFRDPMVQPGQPSSQLNRKFHQYLERKIVQHSSRCVFVTRATLEDFRQRYQAESPEKWVLIENGYDESLFEPYDHLLDASINKDTAGPIKILHSGLLYLNGRNPLPFLQALRSVIDQHNADIEVVFRGTGNNQEIGRQVKLLGLEQHVKLLTSIPYDEAIKEMLGADLLAIFQGSVFNKQIPAKAYEYLRAGRPILALTDKDGETGKMLRDWDGVYFADIESQASIEEAMYLFLEDYKNAKKMNRDAHKVKLLSRYEGTKLINESLCELSAVSE